MRNRVADTVAIVVALSYGTVMMLLGDATRPGAIVPWQADLALGVACAGVLLVRRRFPVAVAGVLLPFGAISVAATGAVVVALFTVAIRRRLPLVLLLGGLNVATAAVYFLLHDDPAYGIWLDLLMRGLISGLALGWGLFVQAYRRLTTSLRDRAARLEAEQQLRAEQARSAERSRIAREMHDVLAHRMSLISLHAGALEVRPDVSPEDRSIAAGAIRRSAHDALEELRSVIGVPTGRPEPPQPGLADVPDLITSARAVGMTVDYRNGLDPASPPPQLGRTAYRIVQECLTNARKHGTSPFASVHLFGGAGRGLRIIITNPLHGPSHTPLEPGQGLVGIDERVAMAGGQVTHGPARDEFRTEVDLPWPT